MPVECRIRLGTDTTIVSGPSFTGNVTNQIPVKEFSISDDVMNVSDSASLLISNNNGENSGRISIGQFIKIEIRDSAVANGDWIQYFTGVVTALEQYSDIQSGSNILVSAMDKGWFLVNCHAPTHKQLAGRQAQLGNTWTQLLKLLIDPSWGLTPASLENLTDNFLNTRIKQGRTGLEQNLPGLTNDIPVLVPYTQTEIGQTPWDIIQQYAQRAGVLLNVDAQGGLVIFRPDYTQPASYVIEYNKAGGFSFQNNVTGRPTLRETIDGRYSRVECWSTVVIPLPQQQLQNQNASSTHSIFTPSPNPLPFNRRYAFSDTEAVNGAMRENRAIWKAQLGIFDSWTYEAEFPSFSQGGLAFASNTMISVRDQVNQVFGSYYVQSVHRSYTLGEGTRSRLVIKKPGLLNPTLTTFKGGLGGGATVGAGNQ